MKSFNLYLIILLLFFIACSKTAEKRAIDNIRQDSEKLYEDFYSIIGEIKKNNEKIILEFTEKLDSINKNQEQYVDSLRLHLSDEEMEELENENRERLKKVEQIINENFPKFKQFFDLK